MNSLFAALVAAVLLLLTGQAWAAFAAALVILLVAAVLLAFGRAKYCRLLVVTGIVLLLAAVSMMYHSADVPEHWYGCRLSVQGTVTYSSDSYFDLRVTTVEDCKLTLPLCLRVYADKLPAPGSRISCQADLFRAETASNPGQFDYRAYLESRGISALASCQSWRESGRSWWVAAAAGVKSKIVSRAHSLLPQPYLGIYAAMIVGDKGYLSEKAAASFAAAGLAHVLVVSGLHVGMLSGLLLWLLVVVLRLPLRAAYVVALLVLVGYAALVGLQVSALRAVFLIGIALFAKAWYKSFSTLSALSAAALILLLWQPQTVYSLSFQLSFAATAALLWLYPALVAPAAGTLRRALTAALAVQLATVPIIINSFNYLSLYALAANLPAIPLAFAGMVCGLLLLIPGLGRVAAPILKLILGALYHLADWVAGLPYAQYSAPAWPVWVVLLYYTVLVSVILVPKRWRRWPVWLVVALVAVFVVAAGSVNASLLRVTFVDVGQGDSAVVELPGKRVIVIDAGEPEAADDLVAFLRSRGINKVEAIFISHGHSDHLGGAQQLIDSFAVQEVYAASQLKQSEDSAVVKLAATWEQNPGLTEVRAGERLQLSPGCYLKVLSPPDSWLPALVGENNCSLVLKLVYGQIDFLFTGDIEAAVESYLCDHCAAELASQVLKVAHHGSATSSSARFLACVQPQYAVISVGDNSFGHPSPQVLDRLGQLAQVYLTNRHGAITVLTDGRTLRIQTFNQSR